MSALGNVHTLDLSYTNIISINGLENVKNLNLEGTNFEELMYMPGDYGIMYASGDW